VNRSWVEDIEEAHTVQVLAEYLVDGVVLQPGVPEVVFSCCVKCSLVVVCVCGGGGGGGGRRRVFFYFFCLF
jgi:hypothetical protein